MAKKHFYAVWTLPNEPLKRGYTAAYHVSKYDKTSLFEDGEPYVVKIFNRNNWYSCTCPGFENFHHCRHQHITQRFIDEGKINSGQLYDFDNKRWSNRFIDALEDNEEM